MSSDQTSKDARRRTALAKTLETVRARREALARETSATRRAVEAAKAHGWDAAECLAELWASFTREDPRKATARKVRDALTCCARSAGDGAR